jgi:hypothetical protein
MGHEPTTLTAPLLEEREFDLVVADVRMPEMDGIELIERIARFDPRAAIIAMTAFGSIDTAMRAGAFDYLPKPFQPADMALRLERALGQRAMTVELTELRSEVAQRFSIARMVGRSRAIEEVITLVRRVGIRAPRGSWLPPGHRIRSPRGSWRHRDPWRTELPLRGTGADGNRRALALRCRPCPGVTTSSQRRTPGPGPSSSGRETRWRTCSRRSRRSTTTSAIT